MGEGPSGAFFLNISVRSFRFFSTFLSERLLKLDYIPERCAVVTLVIIFQAGTITVAHVYREVVRMDQWFLSDLCFVGIELELGPAVHGMGAPKGIQSLIHNNACIQSNENVA